MANLRERLQASLGSTYTLDRELAGGGMSRVFVAHEAALDRLVVVKVLPPEMSAAVSAERFKREIALAAKLQHPHIVPVLTAGDVEGVPFYTMPFVEGESLRARLVREGELPIADAVSILKEVARALSYAHERGIIHRDIKPDNVLLSGGSVMVTDFGVAKALSASTSDGGTPLTQLGVALGTPAYMAPEQASAEPTVDHRADLYALGCMAYELATGQTPFGGRPGPSQLAAHVTERPEPIARRRANTPAPLAALVMQCLEKRPADRPRDAQEVLRLLESVVVTPSAMASVAMPALAAERATPAGRGVRRWLLPFALGGAGVAAIFAMRARRPSVDSGPVIRVSIPLDQSLRFAPVERGVAISPDGQTIAFIGISGAGRQVFVRRLDESTPHPVTPSQGHSQVWFSPDGKWLLIRGGTFRRVPVAGGRMEVIDTATETATLGADWGKNDTIVIATRQGLATLPAFGNHVRAQLRMKRDTARNEYFMRWPLLLPDGRTVIYARLDSAGQADNARLAVASLANGESRSLELLGTCALGLIDDHLVYANASGSLMAVRFDARRARVIGTPITVLESTPITGSGCPQAALSRNGSLIYESNRAITQIMEVDERGMARAVIDAPGPYARAQYSPDGTRIAVQLATSPNPTIAIYDLKSATLTPLTTGSPWARYPEWSPDGKRIYFVAGRGAALELWSQSADGSDQAARLFTPPTATPALFSGSVTPNGTTIVYSGTGQGATFYARPLAGDSTPRVLMGYGESNVHGARVSPDGKWVAYSSNDEPRFQVYVQPFDGPGPRVRVSTTYGAQPVWSRDGSRLYYRGMNDTLMVAEVRLSPVFQVVARRALFTSSFGTGPGPATYDVSADGKHILMPKAVSFGELAVIHNWRAQVRERIDRQGQ